MSTTRSRKSSRAGAHPRADLGGVLDPLAPESESLRMLRTSIRFSSAGTKVQTVLITSAEPQAGKSMIAANLALSLGQVDPTLLIDADLRRPTQDRVFRRPGAGGLTTILVGGGHHEGLVSRVGEGLDLITSGPLPPNPSELLASQEMANLLAEVTIGYDNVVIDGPPVLMATEATVLASMVDGVILVVDIQRSRRREITRSLDLLDRAGARVLGTCVNRYGRALRRETYYS